MPKDQLEIFLSDYFQLKTLPVPILEDQNLFLNCKLSHAILKLIDRLAVDLDVEEKVEVKRK